MDKAFIDLTLMDLEIPNILRLNLLLLSEFTTCQQNENCHRRRRHQRPDNLSLSP